MSAGGPPFIPEDGFACSNDTCDNRITHPEHVTVQQGRAVDYDCPECGRTTMQRTAVTEANL